jgi:hypothetical protein
MSAGAYVSNSFTYLNLGCHMMFVLKNRIKAQSINDSKGIFLSYLGVKILCDILLAVFN